MSVSSCSLSLFLLLSGLHGLFFSLSFRVPPTVAPSSSSEHSTRITLPTTQPPTATPTPLLTRNIHWCHCCLITLNREERWAWGRGREEKKRSGGGRSWGWRRSLWWSSLLFATQPYLERPPLPLSPTSLSLDDGDGWLSSVEKVAKESSSPSLLAVTGVATVSGSVRPSLYKTLPRQK